ncbi:MAG TPA: nitroreductase family protein [Hyphomicrobiaceae bacterium]|nr:nitroreductase family protein [Hyphomicrobiaceae bacterium]
MLNHAPPTSETIEVLQRRVSVRDFADRPVDDATVDAVLKAAFRAPTSSNIQAYSVIIVRDPDVKAKLAPITGGQKHVISTPVFLAFCADLTRMENAFQRHGHTIADNNLECGLVSSIDAALVGMSAYLAAESLGLKGVMIGAVRNDAVKTAEVLGLPHRVYCVFGMCLGWPGKVPPQKPRIEYPGMIHYEQYGNQGDSSDKTAVINRYDADLGAHYTSRGIPTTPNSWTNEIDKKFSNAPRPGLRAQLAQLGFDFK